MRILIIAPRFHINLHDRIKSLLAAGHSVSMIVLNRGASENYSCLDPETVGYSKLSRALIWATEKLVGDSQKPQIPILLGFPSPVRIFRRVRALTPDLVVVKGLRSLLAVAALSVTRLLRIDTVVFIQRPDLGNSSVKEKLICFLVFDVFGVKSVASPVRDTDQRGRRNHDHFAYVPFVYDVVDLERRYLDNGVVCVLNISRFLPSKGQAILVKAFAAVSDGLAMRLLLVGPASDPSYVQEVESLIQDLEVRDRVELVFGVPHSEALKLYRQADVFVQSSLKEPASLQVLEAMANKVAVISSDGNGTKCYIRPEENGLVFQSGSVSDLEAKLWQLASEPARIKSMGETGFQMARSDHQLKLFNERLMKIAHS